MKQILSLLSCLFLLLILFQTAWAQQTTPPWVEKSKIQNEEPPSKFDIDPTPLTNPIEVEYRLAPDDLITVNVWRHPEISTSSNLGPGALGTALLVSPDGYISFPFLGRVKVLGMTLEEFRLLIMDAIKDIYRNPVVTVGLGTRRKFRLYVLGEVRTPGLKDMEKPELTIAEALTLAGGTSPKAAVERSSLLRDGKEIPLDLSGLVYRGEAGPPIKLRPEDQLVIPEMRKKVAVIGEVAKPGVFEMRDEDTLFHVIAMAGGFTDRAKPSQTAIIRHKEDTNIVIPVNTREIFAYAADKDKQKDVDAQEKAISKNIQLEDRDIVYVPQLNNPKWTDIYNSSLFLYYLKLLFPNWK